MESKKNLKLKVFRLDIGSPDCEETVNGFCAEHEVFDIKMLKADGRFATIAILYKNE